MLSILLFGCENWPGLERETQLVEVFQMNCLRFVCGYTLQGYKSNDSVTCTCHLPSITGEIMLTRLRWLGHRSSRVKTTGCQCKFYLAK